MDFLLQPHVKSIKTILRDSQQLLQEMENYKFNCNEVFLSSCDFESLYTNMKPNDTIDRISQYLSNNVSFNTDNLDIIGFREILKLIFTKNIFSYNDKFYIQRIGIPMGCKCGPTVANLYLYTLEKSYLNLYPDIIYKRFIDDIFIASTKKLDKLELCNQFGD